MAADPAAAAAESAPTDFTSHASLAAFQQTQEAYLAALADTEKLDGIATGACVFRDDGRLLLIQRAPEDSMPDLWEIPGGACDPKDASLLHAVARELKEETGLEARNVEALVFPGEVVGKVNKADVFTTKRASRKLTKFTFLVEVESCDKVTLDPEEHVAFLWVTEEEAKTRKCGDVEFEYTLPRQRETVLEAFELRKRGVQP